MIKHKAYEQTKILLCIERAKQNNKQEGELNHNAKTKEKYTRQIYEF